MDSIKLITSYIAGASLAWLVLAVVAGAFGLGWVGNAGAGIAAALLLALAPGFVLRLAAAGRGGLGLAVLLVAKLLRFLQYVPVAGLVARAFAAAWERLFQAIGLLEPQQQQRATADVGEDAAAMSRLAASFDPEPYIDLRKGIFLGLDETRKPIYVPQGLCSKNHWQILGESGVGKSSLAGVLLSQLAMAGETVIVFDPKSDANLPGVLARMTGGAGVPMKVIDLRMTAPPQLNPLAGCRQDQVEELLQVGLELGKTGHAGADFYRGEDREKVEALANYFQAGASSLPALLQAAQGDEAIVGATNLFRELRQLCRLPAFNTAKEFDLSGFIANAGLLYVIGSTVDLKVQAAQRLLLQRVMQIIEERQDRSRPIATFLDELKFLLSPAALRAASTIRDRNCHLIFAHQSQGDLHDCPGLDANAVIGAVWGNSSIRIVYKTTDAKTCKELELLSGKERAWSETTSKTKELLGPQEGGWRESERYRFPAHIFAHLPKPLGQEASVGIVFGVGPAFFLSTRWLASGPAPQPEAVEPYVGADGKPVATSAAELI
ncbi:type IV secretory system conjugative DNA transfer family protein [Sulfurisoma sediminicola]|uniref:type IV secretory system conjugative DNA transfer family protein n=1 Tax=Sulfurisoma sediminicola TaxID=1381557 RepID=UPI00147679ED|nr:TraM recognition domain-containing protein [Sulfurisoma sediminicola]